MARKKQEIQLQSNIENQEEWEDMLSKEGLTVVDVYQEWCGPCKAMLATFKRINNELGDSLLRFVTAKADTVDSLMSYKGRCEPCFLFYGGGVLTGVQRGVNVPEISKSIPEQLAAEKQVLEGMRERKAIQDPTLVAMEAASMEESDEDSEEEDEVEQEITVAIIKPDVVRAGRLEEVLQEIENAGMKVLKHEERHLKTDEAKEFYSHLEGEMFYEELIEFMCSGVSHILVLRKGETGKDTIKVWRDLIGPTFVEDAKTDAPDSFRAKYGEGSFKNAFHGSDGRENAAKELAFFFPDFQIPKMSSTKSFGHTIALIRPDALEKSKDEILKSIEDAGFTISMCKEMVLSKEQAEEFYKEHVDEPFFEELVAKMSCGPTLVLALASENAVSRWRDYLGPKTDAINTSPDSLRAKFANPESTINPLHGSDSTSSAKKEINFFFPVQKSVALIKPDAFENRDEIVEKLEKDGFSVVIKEEKMMTSDLIEDFYKDQKDKSYYDDLVKHMTSGPSMVLVLSRPNCIEEWRKEIGPTDPEEAKKVNPNSLRALYGTDSLRNAVHGSSNEEHVERTLALLYPNMKDTLQEQSKKENNEDTCKVDEKAATDENDSNSQKENSQT